MRAHLHRLKDGPKKRGEDTHRSKSMSDERDWEGKPLPPDETADAVIKVWEISPHPNGTYDYTLIRSWHEVKRFLADTAELYLHDLDESECAEGVTIKIRLVTVTRDEYEEVIANVD
jgi:hypothetical protein